MPKLLFCFLYFVLSTGLLTSQNSRTISGYVKDDASGESLPGTLVRHGQNNTYTNNYGFFSLPVTEQLSADSIFFIALGYEPRSMRLEPSTAGGLLEIKLRGKSLVLKDVEISTAYLPPPTGMRKLDQKQIKALPALLGEKDALKIVQLLPGVQKGNEGNSGLNVRGGSADQNLVLLDEAPVYNLNHFFGLFSVFNGDAVKSLDFFKGNIPARYGGRLSSVLDFTIKDGDKNQWHGEGGIGLLSSRFVLNGPLVREKSSLLFAARRSYFDLLFSPLLRASNGVGVSYFFQDYNLKANYRLNSRNYLIVSGYSGKDRFKFSEPSGLSDLRDYNRFYWGNRTATLRWNHTGRRNYFSNTSFILNQYRFFVDYQNAVAQNGNDVLSIFSESGSGITDFTLKHDWFGIAGRHEIRAGAMAQHHLFTPSSVKLENDLSPVLNFSEKEQITANEYALYAEDQWKIRRFVFAGLGLRLYGLQYAQKTKVLPEPRAVITYRNSTPFQVQIGYCRTNQFLQLLSNSGINLPTDFWVPSTSGIKPQQADQFNAGLGGTFKQGMYGWNTEVYYKKMANIASYREGSSFIDFSDPTRATPQLVPWQDILIQGRGESAGFELLLEKKKGALTGWIGYTLSKTTHEFKEINNGKPFAPYYDRRHGLNLAAVYRPNPKRVFSVIWTYASPNPVPLPVRALPVQVDGEIQYLPYYGARGSVRERSFHRLDISVQFNKQKKRFVRTWEIGIFNVYNRKNPFYYTLSQRENNTGQTILNVEARSLFTFIPNISYNFSF